MALLRRTPDPSPGELVVVVGGGGEEGLFHVTPHSTKAQAGREAQDKTCVPPPTPHTLSLPPPPPLASPSPHLFFTQTQPLPFADDLNIYQTAPWWNSS